jgi:hypothetical protein
MKMIKKCKREECNNLTKNPKFCSLSCGAKYQQKHTIRIKTQNIKKCKRKECEKSFNAVSGKRNNLFCSQCCAAIFNNRQRGFKRFCVVCNNETKNPKFCSLKCFAQQIKDKKALLWESGEWGGEVKSGLSRSIKNYLIEECKNRCTNKDCSTPGGFSQVNKTTGKVPLEVHHKDGNYLNNKRENLEVLCPNCHALTETFKGLNKGKGRRYRK